jgi:hypothetical protein
VIIPQGAAAVLAVWTLHTYAIDAFQHTPYILVTSPVRECGKSTLMDALEAATNKAFLTVSITAAVAFRLCEQFQPTLLLDEADNSLPKEKTELLGLLNAGHRRGARASRCEGDDNKLRFFKVFGPKVIAGIGKQKDTLESRSIIIHMVRKLAGEKVARIKPKRCETLRQQCRRWADDHTQAISEIDVQLPDEMGNREADKWEPLFAIADVIGGAWPNKMRAAVGLLKPVVDDSEAISVQLLHDVWGNFGEDSERMFTDEILEALHRMEERPWRHWYKGNAISSSQLSKRLGAFGIASKQIRHAGDNRRGYRKQDLADAVLHYPLAQGVTTLQVNGDGASSGFEGVTPNPFVTPANGLKPLPDNGCNTVTPAQGGTPEDEGNPPPPTVRETF